MDGLHKEMPNAYSVPKHLLEKVWVLQLEAELTTDKETNSKWKLEVCSFPVTFHILPSLLAPGLWKNEFVFSLG